jgi:hypothetical protein
MRVAIQSLHAPLQAAGLVPPNCRLMEISIGVTGAMTIRYEVYVTADELVKLGSVFQGVGDEMLKHESRDRDA